MALDRTNDQVAERLAKLDGLRERGLEPYPYRYPVDTSVTAVRAEHAETSAEDLERAEPTAALGGRILAIRRHGKAGFADVSDGRERLQVYIKKNLLSEEDYAAFELLDIGDWVGVTGVLMQTRTGELTLRANQFTVLSKALRPLPVGKTEVVDGKTVVRNAVVDKEYRYRQRSVDLAVNPDVRRVFEMRTRIVSAMRRFLDARGFLEVETPVLQPLYGGASARPFTTALNALGGMTLYLRIADELYLKRLVVGGLDKVYEIGKDFRNEGIDRTHNPEFTMLELYQAFADYGDMADLTETLVATIAQEVLGTTVVERDGQAIDLAPPWRRVTMLEAIRDIGGVEEDLSGVDRDVLLAIVRERSLEHDPKANAGQLLDVVFSELVQPKLVDPTFVLDYPKAISPLAKQHRVRAELTERFEPFVAGWELGNAFSELNNPQDQRQRFEDQARLRAGGDEEAQVLDEDYLVAMEHGMPPMGGMGLGVDRLVMLLTGCASIRDVLLFPFMRPAGTSGGETSDAEPDQTADDTDE